MYREMYNYVSLLSSSLFPLFAINPQFSSPFINPSLSLFPHVTDDDLTKQIENSDYLYLKYMYVIPNYDVIQPRLLFITSPL